MSFFNNEKGTTLTELLVVMAIGGIIGATALYRYVIPESVFDRMQARDIFVQDVKRAQAEAITQGCRGIFTVAGDGRSYTYGCDFLSYDTTNPPAPDSTSFSRTLPGSVSLEVDKPIIFNSRGQAVTNAYVITTVSVELSDDYEADYSTGIIYGTGLMSLD